MPLNLCRRHLRALGNALPDTSRICEITASLSLFEGLQNSSLT